MSEHGKAQRVLTLPNLLGFARLFATPFVLLLARSGQRTEFLLLIAAFFLTDWLDGRLARWLGQETELGARLDSLSDVVLYLVLCLGIFWMEHEWGMDHMVWFTVLVLGYFASVLVALVKFGRAPTYHTRAAKMGWGVVGIGALSLLMEWSDVPALFAFVFVTVGNLEAILITLVLPEYRVDISGLLEALRIRRGEEPGEGE